MSNVNATKTLLSVIGLFLLVPMSALQAQTNLRVKVPFDFNVQNKTFESGQYHVKIDETAGLLEFRLPSGAMKLMVFGSAAYRPASAVTGTLVFHKYGDRYFLRKIWMNGRAWGRELPMSKVERESALAAAAPRGAEVAVDFRSR